MKRALVLGFLALVFEVGACGGGGSGGTAGSGGHAAGHGGAGSGGSTAGSGGSAAGSGGSTAGSGGSTAGSGGSTAGAGGTIASDGGAGTTGSAGSDAGSDAAASADGSTDTTSDAPKEAGGDASLDVAGEASTDAPSDSAAALTFNASCNTTIASICTDDYDVPANNLAHTMDVCTQATGTWDVANKCTATGKVGGCRRMNSGVTLVFWYYSASSAATGMTNCTNNNGTWLAP